MGCLTPFSAELSALEVVGGQGGQMSILVQLLQRCYLICLPACLSIISLLLSNPAFSAAACSTTTSEAQGGRCKALLGSGGSGLVFLPVLICWLACLASETAHPERAGRGASVAGSCSLRAARSGRALCSLSVSGCTHLLQASLGFPLLPDGAEAVPVPSGL